MIKNLEELFYPKVIYKKHPNTQEILNYAIDVLGTQTAVGEIIGVSQKTVSEWMNREEGISLDKEKIMPLIKHLYPRRSSERHLFNVVDTIYLDVDKLENEFEIMINNSIKNNIFDYDYFGIEEELSYFELDFRNYKNLWKIKNYDFIQSFGRKKSLIKNKYENLNTHLNNLKAEILDIYSKNIKLEKEYNDKKAIYDKKVDELKSNKDWNDTPKSMQDKLLNEIGKVERVEYNDFNLKLEKLLSFLNDFDFNISNKLDNFKKKSWKIQKELLIKELEHIKESIDMYKDNETNTLKKELELDISKLEKEFNNKYYPDFKAMRKLNKRKFGLKEEFLTELGKLIPEKLKMVYYDKDNWRHHWRNDKNYRNEILKKENLLKVETKKAGFIAEKIHEIDIDSYSYEFFILYDKNKAVIVQTEFELINNEEEKLNDKINNKPDSNNLNKYRKIENEMRELNTDYDDSYHRGIYSIASGDYITIPIIYELKRIEEVLTKISRKEIPILKKTKNSKIKSEVSKIWEPMSVNELIKKFSEKVSIDAEPKLKEVFFYAGYEVDDIEILFE